MSIGFRQSAVRRILIISPHARVARARIILFIVIMRAREVRAIFIDFIRLFCGFC